VISLRNEQIADHARVSLISRGARASKLSFSWPRQAKSTQETFHELVVEGKGEVQFDIAGGKHFLYLDDLIIGDDSQLQILNWEDGRDYLLVKKTSVHLEDAIKKIAFRNYYDTKAYIKAAHIEDYDDVYWAISIAPVPEPATYGGLLVAGTVSLSLLRRRLKSCRGRPPRLRAVKRNPNLAAGVY